MAKTFRDPRLSLSAAFLVGLALGGCGSSSKTNPKDGGPDAPADSPADLASGGDAPGEAGPDVPIDAPTDGGLDVPVDAPTDAAASEASATDAGDAGVEHAADGPGEASVPIPGPPTPAPDFVWYVLDETSGTTAKDSSSHHYDITNLTGVTWSQGANFDGVSGGGSTTVGPSYRSPPITLTAWLKPAARADGNTVRYSLQPFPPNALSDDVPGVGGYGIGLNVWTDAPAGSALEVEGVTPCTQAGLCAANGTQNAKAADAGAGDGGLPSCTSPGSCNQGFVAGVEHFVAVTISAPGDGGAAPSAEVYVDGQLFDEGPAYVPAANASPPLYLGCHNLDTGYGSTRVFDGRIRDVRVYQRQLAPDEVRQLFINGPTTKAPTTDGGGTD